MYRGGAELKRAIYRGQNSRGHRPMCVVGTKPSAHRGGALVRVSDISVQRIQGIPGGRAWQKLQDIYVARLSRTSPWSSSVPGAKVSVKFPCPGRSFRTRDSAKFSANIERSSCGGFRVQGSGFRV
jgi:hypothetical protein